MYRRINCIFTTVLLSIAAHAACALDTGIVNYTQEHWNAPARQEHNWDYWDMVNDPTGAHPKLDMIWEANGGHADSGHVWSPLDPLDPFHDPNAYWPAYLTSTIAPTQLIDLSFADAQIRVYASDITARGTGAVDGMLDMKGGQLHFFIGEWLDEDDWRFFYNRTPLTINDHTWTAESVIVVGGDSDWGLIASSGLGGVAKAPSALFHHPEQWGFVIFPASSPPTGTLALDAFRIVPEPGILILLATGALVLARREPRGRAASR